MFFYTSWKFHPFWPLHRRKLRIGRFDHCATRTWDRILKCDGMGQISKFLPWRENFGPERDASGLENIPPGNFTHYGLPTDKNLDLVFLTVVQPEPGIVF